MNRYHIYLTEEEAALVESIDLRVRHKNHEEGHSAYEANRRPILVLLRSLGERGAIPQARLHYWNDPDYNTGRSKTSHKGVFERNGCTGENIYTHPHFVPYLRYFLFGADLPAAVIASFEDRAGNPEWITSSDIVPIGKHARDLARQHGLERTHAPEEFFKLCLDMGLGLNVAEFVRRSVAKMR